MLSPDNPEDSISNSTNANSRPDTANSVPYSASSTPDTTDSIPDNANSIPGTANSVLDIADSVPDIVDSIPHSANSIPDTTNSVPDIEATNTVPTSSLEPKLDHEPASLAPDLDATVADPAVDQDTVFIDYMNQPDPLEQLNRSQRKDAEPRRAAGSFEITGADPIATSGDHAIDSNDVAVAPEANEDTELEISHLVHDWMDKVICTHIQLKHMCMFFWQGEKLLQLSTKHYLLENTRGALARGHHVLYTARDSRRKTLAVG